MFTRRRLAYLFCLTYLASAQNPTPTIQISGDVKQPLSLTADDLSKMPRASLKIGTSTYEGVRLDEVLKRAGVPQGGALRGPALAGYVLAHARDGYQVLFSLGELDPSFLESEVLVADRVDGKALTGELGPFRLLVPKDLQGARSVRMLMKLEVVQLRKP